MFRVVPLEVFVSTCKPHGQTSIAQPCVADLTSPVFNMGRSKLLGLVAVCALTLINIWMAKYVVKPFKEAERLQQVHIIKDRRLSDVLIVTVDDIHPLQHIQEADAMEATHKPTTRTSSLHATPSTSYHPRSTGYPSYRYQALDRNVDTVADVNNHWRYNNSALVDAQSNGQLGNLENNMAVGSVNPETNNNVKIITGNDRNMSLPYSNIDHSSYLQNTNTHERQPTGWNKHDGILQASAADTLSNHLKYVNTAELVNIKNNLETLKNLLGKFNPNSRQSVLHQLMRHGTVEASQPAGQPGMATFVDKAVEESPPGHRHVQAGTAVNPLEYYLLSSASSGLNPPQMAAPIVAPMDFHLLTKLLNATNRDNLNMIINKHGDAVRYLLSQILDYLQQRRQELLGQHPQQHTSDVITSGHSEPGARATQFNGPSVSLDYNKNAIKEMIKNIAKYNKVDTRFTNENVVGNFLQKMQTGNLRNAGMSDVGDMPARTLGSGDYNRHDLPGSVMLPHN